MRELLRTRSLLLFGGKGGVGKTTCAAAAALAAARDGRRVLLISTDPAHSTSDVLGMGLGSSPRGVSRHLDAVEIDPLAEARRYLDEVRDRIGRLFSPAVARQAAKQIDAAADTPGIEEAALLERLMSLVGARDRYDLTIVDTAPTGHTLRLLRMPETMGTWVSALVKARSAMADESKEPDPLLDALRLRMERLKEWRHQLTNRAAAAFVLVLTPERLPIEETVRAARELESVGIAVGAVVVNKVLPPAADGTFLEGRRRQEAQYLSEIARVLVRFPRVEVPQLTEDVHGIPALELVGEALWRSGG
jgi:arsenite-transporting ATPase